MKKKQNNILLKIRQFFFKAMLWFFGITVFLVVVFKWVPVPFTPLMFVRAYEQKSAGEEIRWKHDWVSLKEISRNMQRAVIASEDGTFLSHYGFDFHALQSAVQTNMKGKKLIGGSTISQQTAKNVFLWQGRSYLRKGLEAYFTILIEVIWGKERIMEVYLNSIEWGPGVYGAEAAAQHNFRVSAARLTPAQAARMAAII